MNKADLLESCDRVRAIVSQMSRLERDCLMLSGMRKIYHGSPPKEFKRWPRKLKKRAKLMIDRTHQRMECP